MLWRNYKIAVIFLISGLFAADGFCVNEQIQRAVQNFLDQAIVNEEIYVLDDHAVEHPYRVVDLQVRIPNFLRGQQTLREDFESHLLREITKGRLVGPGNARLRLILF